VTVAEIADRAGLTERTFFNHFTDKREVLFARAAAFEASVVRHLEEAGDDLDPLAAAMTGLTRAGLELAEFHAFGHARRALVASSTDLRERELIKSAAMVSAIAAALLRRQAPPRIATLTAQAAVTVFNTAFDDWIDEPTADLADLMQRSLADLRRSVGLTPDGTRLPD
jgi:AcrR family transcriptional regulator